ncbi:MAG TPA: GXWXG domain-containing protein [Sporichthyaceae bacterium]|jgi:hypothetical protein
MTTISPADTLRDLEHGATTTQALLFFDSLPAVSIEEMLGEWAGGEIPTGHPMNGLLGPMGWHGKRFDAADDVHPLVMDGRDGGRYSLNPGFLPVPTLLRFRALLNNPTLQRVVRSLAPALRTRAPKARLRMLSYRGVLTATMCYDQLPIHDVFRKVDENTVLGAMDLRGTADPLVFFLRREV